MNADPIEQCFALLDQLAAQNERTHAASMAALDRMAEAMVATLKELES